MSRAAVVHLCQHIAKTPELQRRLESGVRAGSGWDLIVSVGHEHGFEFTAHEAAECFEHERLRRAARESAGHAETHILKQRPSVSEELAETFILGRRTGDSSARASELSLNGLRRVALSNDWNIELSETAADEDDSIFS
ncbi:MAG: hypothetical protein AABP62_18200 [Planctomycetota bacterium]